MAVLWVLLAAHERDAVLGKSFAEACQAGLEELAPRDVPIEGPTTLVVEVGLFRPPAEFVAQKCVAAAGLVQNSRQGTPVRPRDVSRMRPGSDISDDLDRVAAQKLQEMRLLVIGVPDRENATVIWFYGRVGVVGR